MINIITICNDDVFTPFNVLCFLCVHSHKDTLNQAKGKINRLIFGVFTHSISDVLIPLISEPYCRLQYVQTYETYEYK